MSPQHSIMQTPPGFFLGTSPTSYFKEPEVFLECNQELKILVCWGGSMAMGGAGIPSIRVSETAR